MITKIIHKIILNKKETNVSPAIELIKYYIESPNRPQSAKEDIMTTTVKILKIHMVDLIIYRKLKRISALLRR